MNIQEYIKLTHNGNIHWFVDEVSEYHHQRRVNDIIDKKEYLSGYHNILKRGAETYNGKVYEPRKVVLQYVQTIVNFQTSYLLKNPITLTGDKHVVSEYKKIYRKGKYNRIDFDILDSIVKYGNAYEYIYFDKEGKVTSKLIKPENSFPVFNHENHLIAFIESYVADFSDYYIVYYEDRVEQWSNVGDADLKLMNTYKNISGLPICYKNQNELDDNFGRSDLDDIIGILDNMEDLLSKFTDSFYKHHNPIPVVVGQQLKGDGLNQNVVGGGIVLDDGADFKMISNELDFQSFESIYKTLKQALLDISNTPAVSMNNTDVSNLSEVSMKLLFQLADIKAGLNEKYIREGLEKRFEKIRKILSVVGVQINEETFDTLNVVFQYSRPTNEKDIIDNLSKLREIGAVSIETILNNAPYINDVGEEQQRLSMEGALNANDSLIRNMDS